jgi:TRAP-type C4-dicarboxylate transport system substrate-binding protein
MKSTLVKLTLATFALAGALASTLPARAADPIEVKFAYTGPPTSPYWPAFWQPWAQKVEKDSDGTVKIEGFLGTRLATMENVYDRLLSGGFELAYGIHGAIGGKFVKTQVGVLPFIVDNGEIASAALWRVYEQGALGDEYKDVVVLSLYVYPQLQLHFKDKALKTVEDLKGLKIGVSDKTSADTMALLGAVPVSMTPADLYQAGSRGTVNGLLMQYTGVLQFKVHEVTNYHINVGMGSGSGFLLANKEWFEKLPPKAKAAFMKNSGYQTSRDFGAVLDKVAAGQYDTVSKMPGHTMATLDPKERERWVAMASPGIDNWAKSTPDGQKILAAFKAEVAKAKASN